MESNGTSIFVVIFLAVLILSAVLIVWMFVSLVRSELEDERRQMIVGKASTWAFIAVVGGDLIEVIRTAVQQPSGEPASPFIQLVTAAWCSSALTTMEMPSDWQMWIRSIPASPTASAMLLCRTLQCSCAFRSRITGWCVLPSVREATSPTTSKEKV